MLGPEILVVDAGVAETSQRKLRVGGDGSRADESLREIELGGGASFERIEHKQDSAALLGTLFESLHESTADALTLRVAMNKKFDDFTTVLLVGRGVESKLHGADEFAASDGSQEDGGVFANRGDNFSPEGPPHVQGEGEQEADAGTAFDGIGEDRSEFIESRFRFVGGDFFDDERSCLGQACLSPGFSWNRPLIGYWGCWLGSVQDRGRVVLCSVAVAMGGVMKELC